jgi:hypothetical protein
MVTFACLVATRARAQAVPKQYIDLKYQVDQVVQGCPNAVEFRSIVAKELGYDPYRGGSSVGLGIHVRSTSTGIEGVIDWSISEEKNVGERRFSSQDADCRQMMASMGFVVAVQLQLMAKEQATEPAAPTADAESDLPSGLQPGGERADGRRNAEFAVTLSARSLELRSVPKSNGSDWTAMVGVGPSIGFGLGPTPVGQGRIFFGVQHGWAGLELGAEASATSTTRQTYGGGFRHDLRLGTVAACAWHGPIGVCGLAKLGRIRVQGIGVDVSASPKGLIAETGPRLVYALGIGDHLVLLGHVEMLWLLTSWTVDVNRQAVWTMPRLATLVGIDLAAHFR